LAEDGIRDFHVTGVQTCALPILLSLAAAIKWAGVVLSQEDSKIIPSSSAPSIITSISFTSRSREGIKYLAFFPADVIKSEGAIVHTSKGNPPAFQTASWAIRLYFPRCW